MERLDLALAGALATVNELRVQNLADMWTKLAVELDSLQPLIIAINENFPAADLPKSPKRKRALAGATRIKKLTANGPATGMGTLLRTNLSPMRL